MNLNRWRLPLFFVILCIVAATIIGRLFYVQIINRKFYQAQALGQQNRFKEIQGVRGQVYFGNSKDNHGNQNSPDAKTLAINKDKWLVAAVPQNIKNKTNFSTLLSENIGVSEDAILSKLEKSDSYVIIKKDLSDAQVSALKNLSLEGLLLENTPGRYYPQQTMASQLIGFLGGDNTGQYGIEGYYNDILQGKQGISEEKRGLNIINSRDRADLNGSDLYLTIDYNIQFQVEQLLAQERKKDDIDSGQIIVMKPDTGRILALANFPAFNVNDYSKEADLSIFQNSAIQKLFEPGSVFKAFSMAMALQEGKITPDSTFTDTGVVKIGPDTVYNFNHEKYGQQTMSGILEKSINTGAVYLSQLLSHQTFIDYLQKFGFNDKTGIDVQGEVSSQNALLKNGSPFGFATASFGQGIGMTPIQLIRAFGVFANNGKMVKPYVVEKITQGGESEVVRPQVSDQIISLQTASQVNQMLISVVEKGYGDGARIPGYYLAGKTGTAQVPIPGQKGYDQNKTIQSFVGYGPALNPQFIILVKLDNPKVPKSALSAVPIFKKLAQYIIDYWQIPPDYAK